MQNEMIEILDDYIRITELLNDLVINSCDEKLTNISIDDLIDERTKIIKRIEKVKQYVSTDEMSDVGIRLEEIKKLDDKNTLDFKKKTKEIRVILNNLKIRNTINKTDKKNL